MRVALAAMLLVIPGVAGLAATITVAPGGPDAIAVAAKGLRPGDTLLMKAGTYPGGISVSLRGTPEQPITIKAADDGPVVVEGHADIPADGPVLVQADSRAAAADGPAFGVSLSGEHLRLEGLMIRRFAAQGISVSSARNVTVSRCTISHCGVVWSAGIQLSKTADITIQSCLLYHLRNGVIAQDADGTRLVRNTIYHTRAHGVYLISGEGTVLRDNIIYAGGKSGSALYLDHRAAGGLQADYNCYLDSGSPILINWMPLNRPFATFWDYRAAIPTQDQHSFSADPLFVSATPGSEDFRLQPTSPCRARASDGGDMGVIPAA